MSLGRLLQNNLRFHWRANLAVCLGVAVGTAVLTGALLVGDSLRGSLHALTEQRLGWVEQAMIPGRFFGKDLKPSEGIAPAILLQGAVQTSGSSQQASRAGRVTILGVDQRFWLDGMTESSYLARLNHRAQFEPVSAAEAPENRCLGDRKLWDSAEGTVVLSQALAEELGVKPGDEVTLNLKKPSAIPRETALGQRDASEAQAQLTLKVRAVLPADHFGSCFSLNPTSITPRNAFLPLRLLQKELDQAGRINALLRGADVRGFGWSPGLDDWGLLLSDFEQRSQRPFGKPAEKIHHPYFSLESRQLLLEPAVERAALKAAADRELRAAPTFVYLANTITSVRQEVSAAVAVLDPAPLAILRYGVADRFRIPYSIVAALEPTEQPPLGPFLPAGVKILESDEIVLVEWPESPLHVKPGDCIAVTYFAPVEQGRLFERTETFKLRGILPMTGAAHDPHLTPVFPGITDKLNLRDWNPPFPYDGKRIQKRDDDYWNVFRTTPKAYIALPVGQTLWGSRFGRLTSIRLAVPAGASETGEMESFEKQLLHRLSPKEAGFVFDNVRQRGLDASVGGTDFSGLFLGFSFFLIAAALLLVGLLFRLNLDRRAAEIGLLLATGFRPSQVRNLLLAEGAIVSLLGGLLGSAGALAYAWGLLAYLNASWPGELDRSFLRLHVTPQSLLIGYGSSLLVSLATIAWAVRVLRKTSPSMLLSGSTGGDSSLAQRQPRWAGKIALIASLGGLALIIAGAFLQDHMQQAGAFFGGGALLLTAGLATVWLLLRQSDAAGRFTTLGLGMRNASRHPVRSLLTTGLLASAAFLIVAVESFRRQPAQDFLKETGGSGGFALLAESEVPIYQDLNGGPGRAELLQGLERHYRQELREEPAKVQQRLADAERLLEKLRIVAFRLRTGDDASCLNLYQPRRPRLLGVPESLIQRGGFHFGASQAAPGTNPWLLLEADGQGAVRVFAEENTAKWMLGSSLGGTIKVPDERGQTVPLQIAGLLKDSVFQSELLLSEQDFLKLYPTQEGYQFFLIQTPTGQEDAMAALLETAFAERGFEVTPAAKRLSAYLAVENTYLSTFQALGGLGLILGSLGLAVVLLRSVWERRGELALLRALGFRRQALGSMVLAENILLLALGLLVGVAAALLSVLPHILTGAGRIPWLRLLGLLGVVLLVGLAAGAAAMRATLGAPLLPALRKE